MTTAAVRHIPSAADGSAIRGCAAPSAIEKGADVLIVIPALNEQAYIEDVIRTLQMDEDCSNALIILVDDGGRDNTLSIVQRMSATDPRLIALRSDSTRGASAAVNLAVRLHGHGRRWIVRIDAHAKYPPNYPSRLVQTAREHGATSVVTPMLSQGAGCFQQGVAAAQNSLLGTGGSPHRMAGRGGGWVEHGHHALMALEAFVAVGGYDETFSHNEDAELDHRILDSGGRIWLAADLVIIYYPRKTAPSLLRQYFYYGRGRAMTVARHPERRRLRQVLPLAIAPICLLTLLSPLHWLAATPLLAWAGLCLVYGLALARPETPCAAGAGVAAMLMQLAWSLGYWKQLLRGPRPGMPPAPLCLES